MVLDIIYAIIHVLFKELASAIDAAVLFWFIDSSFYGTGRAKTQSGRFGVLIIKASNLGASHCHSSNDQAGGGSLLPYLATLSSAMKFEI